MNCEEALSLLYEMIDKEVSEIDEKELKHHLDHCSPCLQKYNLEKSLHEFIKARLQNGSATQAHADLRMRIRMRLDEIDGEGDEVQEPQAEGGTPRPFRLPAVALATAASVIVLIGAIYFGAHFYTHQRLYVPLEQAHWADESRVAEPLSEADLSLALSRAADQYHYELRPAIDDYHLVSGHRDVVMGQSMMHYLYRDKDSKVSVFLAPAEFFAHYVDSGMNGVDRHSLTFFDHNCRGCRLVFHRVGDVLVITASTDQNVQLLDFIPGRVTL